MLYNFLVKKSHPLKKENSVEQKFDLDQTLRPRVRLISYFVDQNLLEIHLQHTASLDLTLGPMPVELLNFPTTSPPNEIKYKRCELIYKTLH